MTADELITQFGSADAVFAWAEATLTDLRSHFDLTDEEFNALKAQAT